MPSRRIFLSHACDDPDWPDEAVQQLGLQLKAAGFEVDLDYWVDEPLLSLGSDSEWQDWMISALDRADHVVILNTALYQQRIDSRSTTGGRPSGRGVRFEFVDIKNWLYDARQNNAGRIVLYQPSSASPIRELRGRVPVKASDQGPEALIAALQAQIDSNVAPPDNDSQPTNNPPVIHSRLCGLLPLLQREGEAKGQAPHPLTRSPHEQQWIRAAVDLAPRELRILADYRLHRYAHWCHRNQGELDLRFVNLTLRPASSAENGAAEAQPQAFDSLRRLLESDPDMPACLLVGDPGAGKTTLLQYHELELAREALAPDAAGASSASDGTELCVWMPLRDLPATRWPARWRDDPQADRAADAGQWVTECWTKAYPGLPALAGLLARRDLRVRFLFDGVNEVATDQPAHRLAAMKALLAWLAQQRPGNAAAVFSVRRNELLTFDDPAFRLAQVDVEPWSPEQMKQYVVRRLPDAGHSDRLWREIDRDAALRSLLSRPMHLAAQCDLYLDWDRPARHAGELFSALVWHRLQHLGMEADLLAQGLIEEEDLPLLADRIAWKRDPGRLPDAAPLFKALATQAWAMQGGDGHPRHLEAPVDGEDGEDDGGGNDGAAPSRGLTRRFPDRRQRADWIKAIASLGIGHVDPASRRFKFQHQQWLEYFAARALLRKGLQAVPDVRWLGLTRSVEDDLAAIADDPRKALPLGQASDWEEVLAFAVSLAPDPTPWVDALRQQETPLAGRAARAVMERLAPARLDDLRQALLRELRDPARDLRRRLQAGDALGPLGDPRWRRLEGEARADGRRVAFLLPTEDRWIALPPGPTVIGSPPGSDPQAYDDENPAAEPFVLREPLQIAFAPVTNAEFECFVRDGGYEDERWWRGERARAWREGGLPNEGLKRLWRYIANEVDRLGIEAALNDWRETAPSWFAAQDEIRCRTKQSAEAFDTWLTQMTRGKQETEPAWRYHAVFGASNAPAVGICVYEAEAYAAWLTAQATSVDGAKEGRYYRLPREAEWELAARGVMGRRRWPWAFGQVHAARFNHHDTRLQRTSPVGAFPDSDTADGILDMAGNVWEWTATPAALDALFPYDGAVLEQVADGGNEDVARVVRGGAWDDIARNCRPAYRDGFSVTGRISALGFRLVRCPIQNPEP